VDLKSPQLEQGSYLSALSGKFSDRRLTVHKSATPDHGIDVSAYTRIGNGIRNVLLLCGIYNDFATKITSNIKILAGPPTKSSPSELHVTQKVNTQLSNPGRRCLNVYQKDVNHSIPSKSGF
jgi:hypothetical protein